MIMPTVSRGNAGRLNRATDKNTFGKRIALDKWADTPKETKSQFPGMATLKFKRGWSYEQKVQINDCSRRVER